MHIDYELIKSKTGAEDATVTIRNFFLLIFELLTGERLIKIVVAKTLEMCVLAEYNHFIIIFSFFLFDYKIRSETFIIFAAVMILDIFAIAFVHSKAILTLSVFHS